MVSNTDVLTGDSLHSRALAHSRAHCSHSRAPIVHTAVPRENNEHGCVYLRCTAVCKLSGCVEGHPWYCLHRISDRCCRERKKEILDIDGW